MISARHSYQRVLLCPAKPACNRAHRPFVDQMLTKPPPQKPKAPEGYPPGPLFSASSMVGTGGFEPPASCVSSKRSPPELRAHAQFLGPSIIPRKDVGIYTQMAESVKAKYPFRKVDGPDRDGQKTWSVVAHVRRFWLPDKQPRLSIRISPAEPAVPQVEAGRRAAP
jgi:hypothetical protein